MPNGRLLQGVGYGDATVFDPNQAIQQFGQIIAQKRAERQAKDQALINQMASLKADGIRDPDKEDYINKYNDWKQAAIDANNLPRNSRDRLDAIANAQAKYNALGEYINSSKEQKQHENALANMWLSNHHLFSDDAHGKFMKSMQSSMSNPDFISHDKYGSFERYVDPNKVDAGFKNANQALLKAAAWSNPIQDGGIIKQGDKKGVVTYSKREVDPEKILATAAHIYDINDDVKAFLDKKYGNIQGNTPDETKMLRIRQNAIDRGDLTIGKNGELVSGVLEKSKPEFKANPAADRFYQHYYFTQNQKGANGLQYTPSQLLIGGNPSTGEQGMIHGDQQALQRFIDLSPKHPHQNGEISYHIDPATKEQVVTFPQVLQIDKAKKKAYDDAKLNYENNPDKTGNWLSRNRQVIPWEKSDKFKEVTGGDPLYIYSEKSPAVTYKLNPNDPQGYFGQVEQMASQQGIKLPSLNTTLGVKGKGIIPTAQTKPNNNKKVTTMSKINSLVGTKGYEGYSAKELADYYRAQGYTVK